MAFQKGQSGNPGGQFKEKPFLAALNRAIVQEDGLRLRQAAEKVLDLAASGEQWAVQFVADRTDGKPKQQVEQTTEHTGTIQHEHVKIPDLTPEQWMAAHGLGTTTRAAE